MLLGEFAVLHGKHALVCAVDKRIQVSLSPRKDNRMEISSVLGQYSTELNKIKIEKPFQFLLASLKKFQHQLPSGCDISILSEFSDKIGFASSAATTVATLAAITRWLNMDISSLELVQQGQEIVREVQGFGSGADIAASVYGGLVDFTADLAKVEKIPVTLPLHAIYSGYKTATADVLNHIHKTIDTTRFQKLCEEIGSCASQGRQAVEDKNWLKLGEIMNTQQELLQALGVSTPLLNAMVDDLRKQSEIYAAKISGSGMGDCVIALGNLPDSYQYQDLQRIPVQMTLQGVYCEKI